MAAKRKKRAPVTAEAVLRRAMEIADVEGLEGLSMRRLAQAMSVEAMSLYHHFANKDAILDGMVDAVFAQIGSPQPGAPWRETVRRRCHSVRAVLKEHRWALGVMESRRTPGPQTLAHHDAMLGCFLEAGFSLPMTGHAYATVDAFVYGFVHTELQLPFETGPESQALAKQMFDQMPDGLFPHLKTFTLGHVLQPGYSYSAEFEFGLELVLDGLEEKLNARSTEGDTFSKARE